MICMKRDGQKYTRHLIRFGIILFIALFSASCKTGTSVSDKGLVQKRKYQKGFYVNVKTPFGKKQKIEAKQDDAEILAETNLEEISMPQIEEQWEAEILEIDTNSLYNDESYLELEANTGKDLQLRIFDVKPFHFGKIQSKQETDFQDDNPEEIELPRVSTLAVLSFIFAIVSLFSWGIISSIIAMIFGIIGLVQISFRSEEYRGKGFRHWFSYRIFGSYY